MRKSFYHLGLSLLVLSFAACGGADEKAENTEAVPAESNEEDMPQEMFSTVVNDRLQVTMDNVGMVSDTVASSISGYIDVRNAGIAAKDMQLLLHTTYLDLDKVKKHHQDHTLTIEEDGRVPGTWVASNSTCDFTLIAAKDTFRFSTKVETALYRLKIQFRTAK